MSFVSTVTATRMRSCCEKGMALVSGSISETFKLFANGFSSSYGELYIISTVSPDPTPV